MWTYDKVLEYPINIKETNTQLAKNIISQYGGAYCKCYYTLYVSSNMPSSLLKSILSIII